ncbi:MAG: glycosyltransferase 4 family protein [Candidatus Altiarchaeota archaeon]
MMMQYILIVLVAFAVTFFITPRLIPRLIGHHLVGRDMNKEDQPEVPEMGGFAIIAGFVCGVLFFIGLGTFGSVSWINGFDLTSVLAGLSTVLIMALVGIVDDLFVMRQSVKAMLPIFAALPLMAVKAGYSVMAVPFFGQVDFGILYPLFLVPLAITGASNATNMLAGFNGLEAGLGVVMCGTVGFIAYSVGSTEAAVISLAMLGALLAFLFYNWFPAKILIGDVGTLSIGAVVATSVIVGNLETVGVILITPFFLELVLKAKSRFQADSWCKIEGGKLVCPKPGEIFGWGRLVMHFSGGISEAKLVGVLILMEVVFGFIAVIVIL